MWEKHVVKMSVSPWNTWDPTGKYGGRLIGPGTSEQMCLERRNEKINLKVEWMRTRMDTRWNLGLQLYPVCHTVGWGWEGQSVVVSDTHTPAPLPTRTSLHSPAHPPTRTLMHTIVSFFVSIHNKERGLDTPTILQWLKSTREINTSHHKKIE